MSLHIEQLVIDEFRGYGHLCLEDLGHLTIFCGQNAVGKTNIIEALQLLTSGESFRKPSWDEVVSWESPMASIRARFVDEPRDIEHRLMVEEGKRQYWVNGKKKTAAAVRGTCPSVLFIPDHLQMVKASSATRRDAMDSLGAQLSKNYSALKADYAQALKQRNLLIKDEVHSGFLFDSWDESLCVNGARLCVNRWRLFSRLAAYMARIYPQLVDGEQLDCLYLPSWTRFDVEGRQVSDIVDYNQAYEKLDNTSEVPSIEYVQVRLEENSQRLASQELQRHTTLIGPQKDEMAFYINGRNARTFASQGQQRTIVLAWKLAEVELIHEFVGVDPVLLLDDVMSELDGQRRDALTSFIENSAQTFITTTNLGYFQQGLLDQARVIELPIEGTKHSY